jgi:crotonobetainyl-CoA:carnitine CoA-transferase CaiB-like acyl-CoA transferase
MSTRHTQTEALPLSGLRVLEIARVLAGPFAGQTLADLGADVVKVESPSGDDTRGWGPPFVTGQQGNQLGSGYYHACNRGKRSIVADFTKNEDRALTQNLARHADVVIENFKVGGLAKYGLDYASLKSINPRLIYCSITGFGQNGPLASRPGYDFIIQGMSGVMSLTGDPEGEPQKAGVPIADLFTGVYAVIAIQAALLQRERTGQGSHLDLALFDCTTGVLVNQAMNYLCTNASPPRLGNAHHNLAPYQVFPVADGHVIICVGNAAQFERLCEIVGIPEIAQEADFTTNAGRVLNRPALSQKLSTAMAGFARDELLQKLEAAGVPAGPINRLDDVFADPQIKFRQMRIDAEASDGTRVPGVRCPIVMDGRAMANKRASPQLGEDREDILGDPAWGGGR